MPNAANVDIEEIDLTRTVDQAPSGIQGVQVVTKRGKVNDPDTVVTGYSQFTRLYGGPVAGSNAALEIKRAFERGTKLRINRIVHYTDINDSSTADADVATIKDSLSLHFAAASVATNTLHLSVTLSGPVTVTASQLFTSSHNNTMQLLAKALLVASAGKLTKVEVVRNPTIGGSNLTIVASAAEGLTITSGSTTLNAGSPVAGTLIAGIVNAAADPLLSAVPVGPGQDYDNIVLEIRTASNNQTGYFDLNVIHLLEPDSSETYKNLYLVASDQASDQIGISQLSNSALMIFTAAALAGVTDLTPLAAEFAYDTGTNGSTPTATDYAGSSTSLQKLGFFAFDPYDDMEAISCPDLGTGSGPLVAHQAGTAYVENRKDLVYFINMTVSLTTTTGIITDRDNTLIDSSYVGFYGGGLTVGDPNTGLPKDISPMGDILGLVSTTHSKFGPNYSFAGRNRGKIFNAMGPVINFGTPGGYADLNLLANSQINMVVNKSKVLYLSGNFTAQRATSVLSFMSIRFLVNSIKRSLKPYLEDFLEEPNDIPTWKLMYYGIRPYFQALVDNRALQNGPNKGEGTGWGWSGDQFVNTMADLVINNATDVQLGKYKVVLFLKPINSLQEIKLVIALTPAGISFDEAVNLI